MKLLREQILVEEEQPMSPIYDSQYFTIYEPTTVEQITTLMPVNMWGINTSDYEAYLKNGPVYILYDKRADLYYIIHGKTLLCRNTRGYNVPLHNLLQDDKDAFNLLVGTFDLSTASMAHIYNVLGDEVNNPKYSEYVINAIKEDPFATITYFDSYSLPIRDEYTTEFLNAAYHGQPANVQLKALKILCNIYGESLFTNKHSAILNNHIKAIINDFKTDPDSHDLFSVYDIVGDLIFTPDFKYILQLCLFYYDWSDMDFGDLYKVFGSRLFEAGPYAFIFDNYMKLGGDLEDVEQYTGEDIIGSVHEHYIYDELNKLTSWPYEIEIDTDEVANYLRNKESKDFIEACLMSDVSEYWYDSWYDVDFRDIYWGQISADNQETLLAHGINEKNLEDILSSELHNAFSIAYGEGLDVGSQSACLNDFNNAFYDAVPDGCKVLLPYTDGNNTTKVLAIISNDFVTNNLEDVWSYLNDYSSDLLDCTYKAFLDKLGDNFRFYNDDWYDFDEDAFNYRLSDELNEIDWDSIDIFDISDDEENLDEAWLNQDENIWDYETADINGNDVVDTTKHEMSYYRNFLNPKDLEYMQKAKGVTGEIVQMTPNEYFQHCADIFGTTKDYQIDLVKNDRVINTLKKVITEYKKKLCIPMLNKATNQQEGRHRMYVLGDLFGWDKKFPVLVVTNY